MVINSEFETIILWLLEISFVFFEFSFDAANGLNPAYMLKTSSLHTFLLRYLFAVEMIKFTSSSNAVGSKL